MLGEAVRVRDAGFLGGWTRVWIMRRLIPPFPGKYLSTLKAGPVVCTLAWVVGGP